MRAQKDGYAWTVSDRGRIKNYIHIIDLAHFFETFLISIISDKDVPYDERGVSLRKTVNAAGTRLARASQMLALSPASYRRTKRKDRRWMKPMTVWIGMTKSRQEAVSC